MHLAWHSYFFPDQKFALNSTLINCGHEKITSHDYRIYGLKREAKLTIWQYTVAGCGAIEIDGECHELQSGQAFLVNTPGNHIYFLPPQSEQWEFIYLTLYGSEIRRLSAMTIKQYGHILNSSSTSQVVQMAQERLQGQHESDLNKFDISGFAYLFMLQLLAEQEHSEMTNPTQGMMQKINNFIAKHIHEPLTVERLAREVNLSSHYFSAIFHKTAGVPPREYLQEVRMRFALQLLQTEPLSIKEIAARCGFDDSNYFCRIFRKKYGASPNAYRNLIK